MCFLRWENCFPCTTEEQPKKYVILLYISIVDLSRCVSAGIWYCSPWHWQNICPVSVTLSYLYSNYCMKNILGVNRISNLKDFYPSIFGFETFGTGRFFPAYLWCHWRWDIWWSRAARMGWLLPVCMKGNSKGSFSVCWSRHIPPDLLKVLLSS